MLDIRKQLIPRNNKHFFSLARYKFKKLQNPNSYRFKSYHNKTENCENTLVKLISQKKNIFVTLGVKNSDATNWDY